MRPTYDLRQGKCLDLLRVMPDESVHCVVTSPPYFGLRDYNVDGQIGLEPTPEEYLDNLVTVFCEVRRVLRHDGTCWVNMGDSYANDGKWGGRTGGKHRKALHGGSSANGRNKKYTGYKPKDLMGMPWRLALALQADGWYLRSDIIWHKANPMPEAVTDRPTKTHEYVFLFAKSSRYFFDKEAVREPGVSKPVNAAAYAELLRSTSKQWYPRVTGDAAIATLKHGKKKGGVCPPGGRNIRTVWKISTQSYTGAHFATFPIELPRRCLLAGTSAHGVCARCGSPWKRVVEKVRVPTRPGDNSKVNRASCEPESPYHGQSGMIVGNRDPQRHVTGTATIGWQPTCKCGCDDIIPATVLDPFSGSGTTGLAAVELGQHYIGLELNADYIALSHERFRQQAEAVKRPIKRRRAARATKGERLLFK